MKLNIGSLWKSVAFSTASTKYNTISKQAQDRPANLVVTRLTPFVTWTDHPLKNQSCLLFLKWHNLAGSYMTNNKHHWTSLNVRMGWVTIGCPCFIQVLFSSIKGFLFSNLFSRHSFSTTVCLFKIALQSFDSQPEISCTQTNVNFVYLFWGFSFYSGIFHSFGDAISS